MPKSRLPFTSLNSATDTGAGTSVDLEGVANEFTMNVVVTGSPSSLTVRLQGSHDGTNWFTILDSDNSGSKVYGTEYANKHETLDNSLTARPLKPHARYVRANLVTLTGGTSPTVTATVATGEVVS